MQSRAAEAAPYLIRLTTEVASDIAILETIALCGISEKFYFSAKDDDFILGGLGSALTIQSENTDNLLNGFDRLWAIDETIPVFGGFSFDDDEAPSPEWERFGHCRFTLPFVEMRRSGKRFQIAVNYINDRKLSVSSVQKEIADGLENLDLCFQPLSAPPKQPGLAAELIPQRKQWNQMVKKALQAIHDDILKKIVLARKKIITHQSFWKPAQIMMAMSGIDENSFTFFYQIDNDIAFLGRSPERLFRLQDGGILAEAIAGTRPRGRNALEDQQLESDLLGSEKEREEHRFVSSFIESRMRQSCFDVRIESREEILKLKNVQHIITRISGRAGRDSHPLTLARLFHPTPAVGGYPQEKITGHIRQSEPFHRGWYAAPIGWMNKSNADFAVGIRSALINRNQLHIFAGAGIVRQSKAQSEWSETEKKMDNFTAIIGGS